MSAAPDERRPGIIEDWWTDYAATAPLIENDGDDRHPLATFLWRDADAAAVLITINRVTDDLESSAMDRLPGSDLWHCTYRLAADWRGSYTVLATDEQGLAGLAALEPRYAMREIRRRGVCDPRNPDRTGTHDGTEASVAALPMAPSQIWLESRSQHSVRDRTTEHTLDDGRRLWIHQPAGVRPDGANPLIIALDGHAWARTGYAAAAVDNLVAAGAIRPPYVLMVDTGDMTARMSELSIDGSMSTQIVHTLLPWARSRFPISSAPRDIVVSGESLGGLTALKTVFDHSDQVGAALSQSASLWQHDMLDRARRADPAVRLYLTVGTLETVLLGPNRALRDALAGTALRHTYREYTGGHDMACWRGLWADGVHELLAADER